MPKKSLEKRKKARKKDEDSDLYEQVVDFYFRRIIISMRTRSKKKLNWPNELLIRI